MQRLLNEYFSELSFKTKDKIIFEEVKDGGLKVIKNAENIRIVFSRKNQVGRAAMIIADNAEQDQYSISECLPISDLGIMIDCSRNAVCTVATVKKISRTIAMLGYNELLLYMEDTYTVDEFPLFGYLRGRYSKSELREISDYCDFLGLKFTPCIQTLAHLMQPKRWAGMSDLYDVSDILLIGDEKVYSLVDAMFKTFYENTSTKKIHIGMDEAFAVGLGKYFEKHGLRNKYDIISEHLQKVSEIAEKYGFRLEVWGDMFLRFANGGKYYSENGEIVRLNSEITEKLPKNVEIVYWDYYTTDKNRYDSMIKTYKQFPNEVVFVGGLWKWKGFIPDNDYSQRTTAAAIPAILDNGIKEVFFTCWGDDGVESPMFSVLPSMAYASLKLYGYSEKEISSQFKTLTGYDYEDFMLVDFLDNAFSDKTEKTPICPSKYLLYNDLFHGYLDKLVDVEKKKYYAEFLDKVQKLCNGRYGYIFRCQVALAEVLKIKYDMGIELRNAYKSGDKSKLKDLAENIKTLIDKTDKFYYAFKEQWLTENKAHGFDVQDIRIGGLIRRFKDCKETIEDYISGKIDAIEELDDELTAAAIGNATQSDFCVNLWGYIVTPNVLIGWFG